MEGVLKWKGMFVFLYPIKQNVTKITPLIKQYMCFGQIWHLKEPLNSTTLQKRCHRCTCNGMQYKYVLAVTTLFLIIFKYYKNNVVLLLFVFNGICVLDGVVPRDSTLVIQLETTIPLSMYIPLSVLSTCGILLAVSFLVFNVVLRANKFVMQSYLV